MPTKPLIERALRSRVRGLKSVQVTLERGRAVVLVEPGSSAMIERVNAALRHIRPAGSFLEVRPFSNPPLENESRQSDVERLASLNPAVTVDGVIETVKMLVPEVDSIRLSRGSPIIAYVCNEAGKCSNELRDRVLAAMATCVTVGIPFDVQVDATRVGKPPVRRRDRRIERHGEEDEEVFGQRLTRLVRGAHDDIPLVDAATGSRLMTTITRDAPLGCFLPIYDRLMVAMLPARGDRDDYFEHEFGLNEETFLAYCRLGKIVPIFKFALREYPTRVARTFLEDPSVPFVTPRELDYLTARNAWSTQGWIQSVRSDPEVSQSLFELIERIGAARPETEDTRFRREILESLLRGAESFEGVFWRKGHIAAGHFGPAMALAKAVSIATPKGSSSMAPIDAYGAAMHFSMARALGASLFEALVSPPMVDLVGSMYGSSSGALTAASATRLTEVIGGLELAFSREVPPDEYVEILDQENTRRLRSIVTELLAIGDESGDGALRERVQAYNEGVRKIHRRSVESVDISIAGAVAKAGGSALGLGIVADLLQLKSIQRAAVVAGETLDDRLGGPLDRLRSWLNAVPAESIRLYKVRRRLERAAARASRPRPTQ